MRILVTGGTGFVGSHSVRALVDAGHEVRLLVREPGRVRRALDPLDVGEVDYRVGDVTDDHAVREAMRGCDSALHAAGVYALARGRAAEMDAVNPRSTEVVLTAAVELGLDPIVHVSSYVALLPPPAGAVLTAESPVGRPAGPYARSKASSEWIARRHQEAGAPVVITNPAAVWGPHDPHLGESSRIVLMMLHGRMPAVLPGPMAIVDVRDLAAVHEAAMRPGLGPRRFLVSAGDVPFADLFAMLRRVTGRRLPAVPIPWRIAAPAIGRRKRVPGDLEGPWLSLQRARTDSRATESALGVRLRPAVESVEDTVRWLHAAGHLDDRRAGRVATGTRETPHAEA